MNLHAEMPTGKTDSPDAPLGKGEVTERLSRLSGWQWTGGHKAVERTFSFSDYHHTMAFVNAVAWIAHQMDHHPDMVVGYGQCQITLSTHKVGGVTEVDLQAANRINHLFGESADQDAAET